MRAVISTCRRADNQPRYIRAVKTRPTLLEHARSMRRSPTRAEDRVWNWLRSRRFAGLKWRRQHPFGRFILDFYCPELKLAIELDGLQHQDVVISEMDGERELELRRSGIETIRIPNQLLIRDSLEVELVIIAAVERLGAIRS
jgi:very-short-patch-repair endonuclease